MLVHPSFTSTSRPVLDVSAHADPAWTGREFAYYLRGKDEEFRAIIAAMLVSGEFQMKEFTEKAAAAECGISVYQLRKVLGKGRNGKAKPTPTLAEHIIASSSDERIAASRQVGVDVVWDTMVAPVITEDRAQAAE